MLLPWLSGNVMVLCSLTRSVQLQARPPGVPDVAGASVLPVPQGLYCRRSSSCQPKVATLHHEHPA